MKKLFALSFACAVIGFSFGGHEAKAVSCTYDTCITSCTKSGGGNWGGGCSAYCEKTLKERQASGVCKKK